MDNKQDHQGVSDIPFDATEWCKDVADRIGFGDSAAETALIKHLQPGLEMILRSRCWPDAQLSSDLVQETLVIVLKRLRERTMEDPSRVAAFAAQTARQLAFDVRRRFATRRTAVDSLQVERAGIAAPEDESAEQESLAAVVRNLLAELPHDRDREILRRFYLLEQDKSEICLFFGMAAGAFEQVIFRARARMRAMLAARGVGSRDLLCTFLFWVPKSWLH